jgi:CheY-like chemotaxis protein
MPIVDGYSSTKMIRSFEKTQSYACLSGRAALNKRIPIFAVSASLEEKDREKYIQTGFDGWILKPVDFKRVDVLLKGIVDDSVRDDCLYKPGKWEQGGWFEKKQDRASMYETNTKPSGKKPTAISQRPGMQQPSAGSDDSYQASEGTVTPTPVPGLNKADSV